jgi:hypothetical protein
MKLFGPIPLVEAAKVRFAERGGWGPQTRDTFTTFVPEQAGYRLCRMVGVRMAACRHCA